MKDTGVLKAAERQWSRRVPVPNARASVYPWLPFPPRQNLARLVRPAQLPAGAHRCPCRGPHAKRGGKRRSPTSLGARCGQPTMKARQGVSFRDVPGGAARQGVPSRCLAHLVPFACHNGLILSMRKVYRRRCSLGDSAECPAAAHKVCAMLSIVTASRLFFYCVRYVSRKLQRGNLGNVGLRRPLRLPPEAPAHLVSPGAEYPQADSSEKHRKEHRPGCRQHSVATFPQPNHAFIGHFIQNVSGVYNRTTRRGPQYRVCSALSGLTQRPRARSLTI